MKKIAVVLTGHLRCWKDVFPNFKERVIDRYNPDIFIHTWNEEGWWIPGDKQNVKGYFENTPLIDDEEVLNAYKPVAYVKEDWNDFNERFERVAAEKYPNFAHRPKNILSMFYKIHQGFSMVEKHVSQQNGEYDMIIRMRPDMILNQNLPAFEMNKFYTLMHRNHLGKGTGDMIQVGNFIQMMFFSKAICLMDDLYHQTELLCPHVISEQHIRNLGMNWTEFNISKTLQHTPKGPYVEME